MNEFTEQQKAQLQEDFSKVWNHSVVEKNPPSYVHTEAGGVSCRYNGDDEERCFYSVCLTDEERKNVIEGVGAEYIIKEFGIKRHADMVLAYRKLQYCHDDAVKAVRPNVGNFHAVAEEKLREFAESHGLKIPST